MHDAPDDHPQNRTNSIGDEETSALEQASRPAPIDERGLPVEVFERITDGFIALDLEWRYTYVNASAEKIIGKARAVLLGKNIWQEFPALTDSRLYVESHRAMSEQTPVHFVEFYSSADIWIEHHIYPAADGLTNYFRDITELKRAEERLRRREEYFRTLVENATDVITVVGADGVRLYDSPSVERLIGYKPEELAERSAFEFIHPDDCPHVIAAFQEVIRLEGASRSVEYCLRHKDESWRTVESVGTRFVDANGQVLAIINSRDITERKRAEAALRAGEERLAFALDAARMDTWDWDLQSGELAWSENINSIFDLGIDFKGTADAFFQLINPADREAVHEAMNNAIAHGSDYEVEYRVEKAGSGVRWLMSKGKAFHDERGRAVRMSGIMMDVSEAKRAEEALRESETRLYLTLKQIPAIIWTTDRELRFVSSAGLGLGAIGTTPDEDIGTSIFDYFKEAHDGGSEVIASHRRALAGESVTYEATWLNRTFAAHVEPLRDPANAIIGCIGVALDITESKHAEERLRESEERYRRLIELSPDAIFVHSEGRIVFANTAAARLLGTDDPAELVGRFAIDIVAPEEREVARAAARRSATEGVEFPLREGKFARLDGSIVPVELAAIPLTFEGKPAVQAVVRDISERKRIEAQLKEKEEQFLQSQKMEAIGLLAGGVAHDFNNLLTAINGNSELALRKLDAASPLRHNLEGIKQAGDRASSLTRQLLAFSRKQVLQPEVFDINTVVSEMSKMLPPLIGEDIELQTKLDPALGRVKADPTQIEQVLLNLTVNARDAMPAGGRLTIETQNVHLEEGHTDARIEITPGPHVMLAVSDNGGGIDDEILEHIFEPFFTTKEQGKGTGLGLSTVYGIVKQSGGSLQVHSRKGSGTTFEIYLPRVDEAVNEHRRDVELSEPAGGSETILLVEDEEMLRALTREVLEIHGYHVLEADSGQAALQLYEAHRGEIHMLLTDVVMPEIGGRIIAERLVEKRSTMRVLYMSGYTSDAVVKHGVLDGDTNFIQKPFTPDALAQKVREVLDAPKR